MCKTWLLCLGSVILMELTVTKQRVEKLRLARLKSIIAESRAHCATCCYRKQVTMGLAVGVWRLSEVSDV